MSLVWSPDYAPVDGDFADVSLLLKGEGTNGSTTILDSSSNNLSVTAVDNAQISTAVNTPFGTGDGVLAFDGTGDYLSISDSSGFDVASSDFTIEAWVYSTSNTGLRLIYVKRNIPTITISNFALGVNGGLATFWAASTNSGIFDIANGITFGSVTINAWTHLAAVRSGNSFIGYNNGIGTTLTTSSSSISNTTSLPSIGGDADGNNTFDGYISNLRITKGVARYTENFDVPTAPFPILSPSTRIEVGDGFDVEAANYILAVEAADTAAGQSGGLEPAVRTAINDFVVGCKSDGIWNAIKASCLLSGARTLEGALVPLKGSAPTNVGPFTASDYDRKTGLKTDGTTKYLDSNQTTTATSPSNYHQAAYLGEAATGNVSFVGSDDASTARYLLYSNFAANETRAISGTLPNAYLGGAGTLGVGFKGVSRDNSSTFVARANATTSSPVSAAAGNSTTLTSTIFAINYSAGAAISSDGRFAFYSIGEALDLALLDTRISDFITAIGAAIP